MKAQNVSVEIYNLYLMSVVFGLIISSPDGNLEFTIVTQFVMTLFCSIKNISFEIAII